MTSTTPAKKTTARRKPAAKKKAKAPYSKETYIKWHRDMLLMRRFEERCGHLYIQQKFGGFCHLYIGQEAILAGMVEAIRPNDRVITAYRDHAHPLALGTDPKVVMAELYGKKTGSSKGKGGSMHMFSREKNFFGGHGIVGAQVPIGLGLGFAHRYRGSDAVSMTYFGDGAINQGQVYESFNMAALWQLPVIFVIENNQYGMGTSVNRAAAGRALADRGKAYGIPGMQVDGMDVLAVRAAAAEAIAHCRAGKGPYILEMQTYRYRGHSMSDPAKYRTREEVDTMRKQHDPLDQLKEIMVDQGVNDEAFREIDSKVKAVVSDAADFALSSPEPDPSELWTDIIIENSSHTPTEKGAA
jgi:pyruvate dehydrogenase E1 component alpha subunit